MNLRLFPVAPAFLIAATQIPLAAAQLQLVGNDINGILYNVATSNGVASMPRATRIDYLTGITYDLSQRTMYGLTAYASMPPNFILKINPATGTYASVGLTGLDHIFEGDLSLNPLTGQLFGMADAPNAPFGPFNLFRMDLVTGGSATIVGALPSSNSPDYSAMAFDNLGKLFIVNTGGSGNSTLLTIDPSTAAVLALVTLDVNLGYTAGMAIDPFSGVAYLADGGTQGTDSLYQLDLTSGQTTLVGQLGLTDGLAGLTFIPEPTPMALASSGALLYAALRRRINGRQ